MQLLNRAVSPSLLGRDVIQTFSEEFHRICKNIGNFLNSKVQYIFVDEFSQNILIFQADSMKSCIELFREIVEDREFPRCIKTVLEKYVDEIDTMTEDEARSMLLDVLDHASNDPNIQSISRTKIWSTISMIENITKK